ncbi:MAG: hypothetical protein P1V81_05265 [Planctomycetota bacterium]|nr:hypothetical protein [Planctomycetota bacterium]
MLAELFLSVLALIPCAGPYEDPRDELLAGVESIASPGSPGGVTVFGEAAWPIVMGGEVAVVAVAELEGGDGGRILAGSQGGYVEAGSVGAADQERFLKNAMKWLSGGKKKPSLAAVGGGKCDLAGALGLSIADDWLDADVLVANSGNLGPERLAAVRAHLAGGGGVILGNTPWGWQQLTPKLDLARDLTLNRLMAPFGLAFDRRMSKDPGDAFPVGGAASPMVNARRAFVALSGGVPLEPADLSQAKASLRGAIGALSDHEPTLMLPMRELAASGAEGFAKELAGWLQSESERRGMRALDERWGGWQLVGPFPGGGFGKADRPLGRPLKIEKELERHLPGGPGPDLDKQWKGRGWSSSTWPVELEKDGLMLDAGELNLGSLLGAKLDAKARAKAWSENAVAYLYRRVEVGSARNFGLKLSADGGFGVWLDGQQLVEAFAERGMASAELQLELSPGVHHLWVKLAHVEGNWRFRMAGEAGLDQALVEAAIDRAEQYLVTRQHADGSWAPHGDYGNGYTAMALYALAKGGFEADHPVMRRGIAYLRAHPADKTYSLSGEVLAMASLDRSADAAYFQRAVDRLASWQGPSGMWAYPHSHEDLSNTIFVALALRAAAARGATVDAEVWLELIEGTFECWGREKGTGNPPLGFSYLPRAEVTGSMTVAGLSCLLIAAEALDGDLPRKEQRRIEEAVERGLAWIDLNMVWDKNPGKANWHYFWVYGIERLGALLKTATLGGVAWYPAGAEYLIKAQHGDGHWHGGHTDIDTVLGLLFLNRATGPTSGAASAGDWRLVTSESTGEAGRPVVRARLAAVIGEPLELWIESFDGGEAEDVDAVEWRARFTTPGTERTEVLARVTRADDKGLGRFSVRLAEPPTGSFELVARALGAAGELDSAPVQVPALYAATELRGAADQAHNLLRGATAGATSSQGGSKPSDAIDGKQGTNWIIEASDREPRWWVDLPSHETATRLVFVHRGPSPQHAGLSRVLKAKVILNGKLEFDLDLDPDPMRRTTLDLGGELRVSRIEILPLEFTAETNSGFSELLLLP